MFILLAKQRTGTHFLRGVLSTHPQIVITNEVFKVSAQKFLLGRTKVPPYSFYRQQRIENDLTNCLPARQPELVKEYFRMLHNVAEENESEIVVDIKYNSLHYAEGEWSSPSGVPQMLNSGFGYIHLVRQDLIRTAVSDFRSRISGKYKVRAGEKVDKVKFSVDPKELINRLYTIKEDLKLVEKWIRCQKLRCLTVLFEEFFIDDVGGELDNERFYEILDFMRVPRSNWKPIAMTQKLSPENIADEVSNWSELGEHLAETPFFVNYQRLSGSDRSV